ncbi:paired amphipathic helix protein Sin3b-like [Zophobas morio]|uniref:paired amphipathic helix protein Sin3b-like n=1 Tax=Zophobas morio TaxID=2755281 RepID=UPI003082C7EA
MHEARNPLQREETGKRRYSSDFHFQLKRGRTAEDHVDLDNYQYVLFFDDLKKCCPHKEAYYNFLRLLNLYNSHLIGREDLLEIAAKFITTKNEKGEIDRTTKLYVTFKEMLGFSCKEEENDFQAPSSDAFLVDVKNFDFSTCKRYGFSYRHKPIEQCNQKCSGKTKLSDEVLNDRLVSFSILTSEEKVDSKKNVYEEALYRVEDERYELDMVLASNLDAIRHLEYQFKRLQEFSEEERYLQKLDSKLGGTSEVLCHAAIERIYGEKAREVVDGIMRHPTSVLPIVLKRLKQKDDDWRKAKRDWDKIWRELTEKNFARSLDYQSPSFKANDKKAIAVKTLLAEIETINSESDKKPHYELVFEDEDVLKDCIELLLFYINKEQFENS